MQKKIGRWDDSRRRMGFTRVETTQLEIRGQKIGYNFYRSIILPSRGDLVSTQVDDEKAKPKGDLHNKESPGGQGNNYIASECGGGVVGSTGEDGGDFIVRKRERQRNIINGEIGRGECDGTHWEAQGVGIIGKHTPDAQDAPDATVTT